MKGNERMEKLTGRVYYLPHDARTDRPVLGYIRGERYALMVDAGNSAAHAALFERQRRELGLPAPAFVGLTHWHWDHVYGLHALGAVSVASRQTGDYLARMARWGWSDEEMEGRIASGEDIPFCCDNIKKEYPDRSQIVVKNADLLFEGGLRLDLGGEVCRACQVGGPHSPDSVVYLLEREGILFLGDCACEDFHHGPAHYPQKELGELIGRLEALDFEIALTGHWQPQSKEEILHDLKEHIW